MEKHLQELDSIGNLSERARTGDSGNTGERHLRAQCETYKTRIQNVNLTLKNRREQPKRKHHQLYQTKQRSRIAFKQTRLDLTSSIHI